MKVKLAKLFPDGIQKWAVTHFGLGFLLVLSIALNGLLTWRALYWQHRVQEVVVRPRWTLALPG
jgi:hypothetical protein